MTGRPAELVARDQQRFRLWLWWRIYALVGGAFTIWLTFWAWTFLPFWLIVAAVISPWLPGTWRPLRLLWLLMLHLTLESLALISMFGLWIGSGFGWRIRSPFFQWCHYDVLVVSRPPVPRGDPGAPSDDRHGRARSGCLPR